MRWTKVVSVWPVGLSGGARWAGPIVSDGKVKSFHTNWAPNRTFPLDMAGFGVSLKLLVKDKPWVNFNASVQRGFLEPSFLEQLTTKEQLEPLADNCTKVISCAFFVSHPRYLVFSHTLSYASHSVPSATHSIYYASYVSHSLSYASLPSYAMHSLMHPIAHVMHLMQRIALCIP